MKNNKSLLIFISLSAVLSMGTSLLLGLKSAWIAFLIFFYIGIFFLIISQKFSLFTGKRKSFFLFWIFFYPVLNIWVLYMIEYNVIPYSWRFFNTLEHTFLMASLAFIVYGVMGNIFKKVSYFEGVIILFSFLLSIGIGIEVLQYIIRVFLFDPAPTYKLAAYYSDTIADTTTNIFSGFFWSAIIVPFQNNKIKNI